MTRPDWDTWALGVAEAVAERGDCTRRKVGAVILDEDHRVVGAGYNGVPPGEPGCLAGACPRGRHYRVADTRQEADGTWGYVFQCDCGGPWPCPDSATPGQGTYDDCIALHAELNACIDAGRRNAQGGVIYVTCKPCWGCVKVIQAVGVARLAYPEDGQVITLSPPFDKARFT